MELPLAQPVRKRLPPGNNEVFPVFLKGIELYPTPANGGLPHFRSRKTCFPIRLLQNRVDSKNEVFPALERPFE